MSAVETVETYISVDRARQRADLVVALVAWAGPVLLSTAVAPLVGPLGQLGLTAVGCVAVIWMWRREGPSVRAEVFVATLCACGVEVLAVGPFKLWRFWQAGWPLWLPFHHALLVLVGLVAARSLPRLLRHPLVGGCAVLWCGAGTAWGVMAGERRDLISVFGLAVLLVVRRHPVMRPRVPVIVVVCGLTDFVGVAAGTWTYQPHDVTGLLTLGNPPAAIAGGFCLVYYIGFRLGPVLLRTGRALIPG